MPLTKDQQKVVNHSSGNILVSASAGSGKTRTMIERAIRLIVEEGVKVNELLCVTFTEKAALEMKERLKSALTEKIEQSGKEQLKEQLAEIATADISTLHAFCAKLIRTYFFTADVAPDFNILDESEATVLKYRSIEKTFKKFYDDGEKWFCTLIDRHAQSRTDTKLKETVLDAYAFCNSEAQPKKLMQDSLENYTEQGFLSLNKEFKRLFDEEVKGLKPQVETALSVFKAAGFDKGVAFAEKLLFDMDKTLDAQDFYAIKEYADYKLLASFGSIKEALIKAQKEEVVSARDSFIKALKKYLKTTKNSFSEDYSEFLISREHTEWFLRVLNKFAETYEKEKQEENVLDFNDLEHVALKVLQDEQVLSEVKNKYKYIFVDEYQDTNGVQESIIDKIENDNVFMVGDVKQSIYGFRGCRSEFFTHKDSLMTAKGQAVVRLNENFRSSQKVVETVNKIFSYCMTKDVYGEDYAGKSELIYGKTFAEDALGRAKIHFISRVEKEQETEKPRVYDILEEKPREKVNHTTYASALVANIINQELEKEIYDAKIKAYRHINYGDIVLLTRSKDSEYVRDLVSGLVKRGIPVESDTTVNVLDFAEIKTAVDILKLIDCFSQDVPLVSALKSPIACITDEELMEISLAFRNDNKRGNFYQAFWHYIDNYNTPLKEKLVPFTEYFNNVRALADFVGAHDILQRIINENNFKGYLLATANGKEKVARLNMFVSASIVADKKLTVREFLNRIEVCPKAFSLSELPSENTVRAMTVHASKGLEFPVVIVCGLERPFNTEDDYNEVLFDRQHGLAVKCYLDDSRTREETVLRGVIREKFRKERIKEEARLFYVATTRAEYSLHLVCSAKEDRRKDEFTGATCFWDFVPSSLPTDNYTEDDLALENKQREIRKVLIGDADEFALKSMKENFAKTYLHSVDTTLPLKYSVTDAVKQTSEEVYPTYVLFDGETTDNEKGNIAHKFLECFDFYSGESVSVQARKIIDSGVLSSEDLNKINLSRIENALNSDVFEQIKGYALYREKSFLVQVPAKTLIGANSDENILVQGIIDLLAVKDGVAYIVDYKYSALDKASLKARYEKQLNLYAYAVENSLGLKVNGKALVNLFTGDTVIL